MKAVILDFLFGQKLWQEKNLYAHIRPELRREIDCKSNRQSLLGYCGPMRRALDSPWPLHSGFEPRDRSPEKLTRSARRKIASLPISDKSWAKDFIVVIPPWDPAFELALVEAIELNPSISPTIPIAVSGLKYLIHPDISQDKVDIDCFYLRLSYFITKDGKIEAKRGYAGKKAKLSVASTAA